jgi:hypothetical protein
MTADAALALYRDSLGFEVRMDVGYGGQRWLTVGPTDQPGTDDERRTIVEMMAKGTFERVQASDAEVVQEPTEQPYRVRG